MTPKEFLEEEYETSFRLRLARAFSFYLPFGDSLAHLFISTSPASTETKADTSAPSEPNQKLDEAFLKKNQQAVNRIVAPVVTGLGVTFIITIVAFLLFSNPIGWALTVGVLAGLAAGGLTYLATSIFQKLNNKWNSRVKLAEIKNLTESEARRISRKLDFVNENDLIRKFNNVDKAQVLLSKNNMDEICYGFTDEQKHKLCAELGLNAEEVLALRKKLGIAQKSLFYLRWASGDSNPLGNQATVPPELGFFSKRFTKEKIGAVIGSVLGFTIGCVGVFSGLPLLGFDLSIVAVPIQVAVLIGTSILGTFLGRDVGTDFNQHEQTTPEKTFADLDEKNHPGRWKIYRLMRNVIAAISFSSFIAMPRFLLHFGATAKDWAVFFAYGVAGFVSAAVRLKKRSVANKAEIASTRTEIDLSKYLTKNELEDKDKALLTLFWLERYFKYKTKLDHSRLSDTIAHSIFWNIRYIYETLVDLTWNPAQRKNKGIQRLEWIVQGIFFGIAALGLGIVKSVIDGALLLPVVNLVWSATKTFFVPTKETPEILQNWYNAPIRFFYHLSPLPTFYKVLEKNPEDNFFYKIILKAPALYLMNLVSVGDNSYSEKRSVNLSRFLEAEKMLQEIAKGNYQTAFDIRKERLETYVKKATVVRKPIVTASESKPWLQKTITRCWHLFNPTPDEASKKAAKAKIRLQKTGEQDPCNKVQRYAAHYAPLPEDSTPSLSI